MEGRLSQRLQAKIAKFSPAEPYVWQMRLTETDFNEIEAALKQSVAGHGGSHAHLFENSWSTLSIIYLAEWYKRRYQSGSTSDVLSFDSGELEKLWASAGISTKLYLYTDDSGNRRWLYSTYVLGGLAIRHELARNDNGRFLKGLCRIYHGENFTLENLDDASRAVAFRESIRQKHSLYAYMRDLLDGQIPFDAQEVANGSSEVSCFIAAVKAANDEVLRLKFRFEWIVNYLPEQEYMTRRLRVWLKPEEVGGGLHQYLRYDRVHLWGVAHPEKTVSLRISIRFFDGEKEVLPTDFNDPLITYSNTGEAETGFVSWNVNQWIACKKIPLCHFTRWQIVAQDDKGKEYVAQEQAASEYMQVWRMETWGDEWSSIQSSQKQTALVFSHLCHLKAEGTVEVDHKPFYVKNVGRSEKYGWHYLYDCATLIDERGRVITFYNRQGYDVVSTKLFNDLFRYYQGGLVRYCCIDDPEIDDEMVDYFYPLVFDSSHIIVRHFKTKDEVKNAQPDEDTLPELVEWKELNGRYTTWCEQDAPPFGLVTLRITVKGQYVPLTVLYLPPLNASMPVERDLKRQTVTFRDIDSIQPRFVSDEPALDFKPLKPTLEIRFGDDTQYIALDVWRPLNLQEFCMDGRVVKYGKDDVATIPYVLKEEMTFNEFGTQGYRSYPCSSLGSIYPLLGDATNTHLAAWEKGVCYEAQTLDADAPASLSVAFGTTPPPSQDGLHFLFWDYDKDKALEDVQYDHALQRNSIVFQSLENINAELENVLPRINHFVFGFAQTMQKASLLKCFEVATQHRVYFFVFKPLVAMKKDDYVTQIYQPLKEKRNGQLKESDRMALRRFADEFQFSWADLDINIDE